MKAQAFISQFKQKTSQDKQTTFKQMLAVQEILDNVQAQGDQALIDYTQRFDQQYLNQSQLKVSAEQLKASWDALDEELQAALILTKERIEAYEERILYQDNLDEELSYVYRPIEKVGVYVPGGTALYPSSVLMTIVPALVAGVKQIVVTTPVFQETSITFAALYLCGVKEHVYRVGGAQAIAALTYGTETIAKVDLICGPGNAYVATAKRLVFGDVGIDSIAGPSEILLYVDDSAPVDAIVYDIFAQAEHDANARTFLFCESEDFVKKISQRLQALLPQQDRAAIIAASLKDNHYQVVDKREQLLEALNFIGAEHVSIQHKDQDAIVEQIAYAGAVFKGYYSMEAIGDYIAGPSHVLPTNRTARFSHGLNANDFRTSHAIINLKEATFRQIAPAAERIAAAEGLTCHERSISIRKDDPNDLSN